VSYLYNNGYLAIYLLWLKVDVATEQQVVAAQAEGQAVLEERLRRVNVERSDLEPTTDVAGQAHLGVKVMTVILDDFDQFSV
jgi:hypothetical protein